MEKNTKTHTKKSRKKKGKKIKMKKEGEVYSYNDKILHIVYILKQNKDKKLEVTVQ